MNKHFAPLQIRSLSQLACLHFHPKNIESLNEDSPAIKVMTDLRIVKAISTKKDTPIEVAHQMMIHRAIRLLFVTENEELLGGYYCQRYFRRTPYQYSA